MKNSKIKLIIFDFYGVIVKGSYRDICQWLGRKYKMSWEEIYKILYHKYFNQAAEGKITEKQFFIKALKELGFKDDWRAIRAKHLSYLLLDKQAFELAKKLQKQGFKILFLSKNTPGQFKDVLKKYQVRIFFKNIINTYDLGLPKANKKTIQYVLKKFKVKPKETIMTDDQDFNLIEPKKLGVKTIFYKNLKQLKKEFNDFIK